MGEEELLKQVALFAGLSRKVLRGIAEGCIRRTYGPGETLVHQGDAGRGLYIILSGLVKVVKQTVGGEGLDIAFLQRGDFFGEMAVLDDAPRSASVVAVQTTECLILTIWEFKAKMKTYPEIAQQILPVVVRRFRETNEKLLALTSL